MPVVLETVGLEKHFGGIAAVAGVSLKIEKGARHALIGPNGAGKTTVINLLTGVLRPSAGRILLEGQDITGGADGLQGVVVAPILGMFHFDIFGHVSYAYCLIVLFVLFLLARRVVYSPFGLSLRAVKGNSLRASSSF